MTKSILKMFNLDKALYRFMLGGMTALLLLTAMPAAAQKDNTHPWKGRRVAYFGDSITDPKNNGSKKKYWNFLEEMLGITPYVYGVSGRQWDDIPRQADKLQKEHGDDFDAIMIFMGTNDFNSGVPIGQWYCESEDSVYAAHKKQLPAGTYLRRRRTLSMNNTFRGRINRAMALLKHRWPKKQIVVLTPIHRAYFEGGADNIQPDESWTNSIGVFFDEYVNSVKEAGNIWAVPVIDVNALSGLYPVDDNGAAYYHDSSKDRLHPNDEGHRRLAATLYWQLAALPCVF